MKEKSDDTWKDVLLARLQDAMWGYGGQNGVVGTTKDHEGRLKTLEQQARDIQTLKEFTRWAALGVVALGGFLMTEPAAKILAAIASLK